MRIIAFPGGEGSPPDEAWLEELDAALGGQAEGPAAEAWRELRADVRSLALPPPPELMRRLELELAVPQPRRFARLRVPAWLRVLGRPQLVVPVALLAALVVAVSVVGFGQAGRSAAPQALSAPRAAAESNASAPAASAPAASAPAASAPAVKAPDVNAPAAGALAAGAPAAAPGRVQQLAASVSLSASLGSVQAVSDGVSRLAVRDEGFVESSRVQVQQHGLSEATLTLRLPSARLSAALAAIGRLAPVSAESQSLQDITNSFDAARRRLADAAAERRALLRALAKATTEGQIDSLRERLLQADGAIAQDQSSLNAVSQRASTAEVEVTVLGSAEAGSEGLTFHRGLHDAGRVLTVAAIVLLIALAALLPLALVLVALVGGHRLWRRYSRERALRP
jgi:hypothetical protein